MMYLILAVLSSFSISLLIKFNETENTNRWVVLASNYISASLIGWVFLLLSGQNSFSVKTLGLGMIGGFLWPYTFYILMWGIREFGLSLTGSVARLSLAVPIIFAVLFLSERPTPTIITGIALTFAAFILLNPPGKDAADQINWKALWFFPLLVFSFGMADVWVNVFNTYCPAEEKFIFMLLIFTFSGVFTWSLLLFGKVPVEKNSLKRGLLLGIPNFFSTFFLLAGLRHIHFTGSSAVVYSLYSVGGVSLAFTAGIIFWRERVSGLNVAGLITAVVAIILLNHG